MNTSTNPLIRPRNPFERRLVAAIDSAKPHRGVGTFEKPLPGGVSQTVRKNAGPATVVHPFYILANGKMHAGTVNGRIPTLGEDEDPIGEDGPALSLTGNKYVYIGNVWDLTFAAGFLSSATLTTCAIGTSPTPLVDFQDGTTLTTYRLVAQIIDGRVMRQQQTTTNLTNLVCDQSDGSEEVGQAAGTWTPA